MTYSCKYKNNPTFPYTKNSKSNNLHTKRNEKKEIPSENESSLFNSVLSPIEKFLGRKIEIDDLILVAIIYVIFTEKDKDNNLLLLCLAFILLS